MIGIHSFYRCFVREDSFKDPMVEHLIRTEHPPFLTYECNRMKSDLLCKISHEFRTPVNVIMSSVQLLEMMGDDLCSQFNRPKVDTCHQYIKQNCYRLLRLINNLIDVVRFDSDQGCLNISNHDIVKTVNDIMKQAASFAQNKNIVLTFHSSEQEIITAFDEDKIRRVILNLLSNSLKFTQAGGTVGISVRKKENRVTIRVRDTGCGIPSERLNNVFDRFTPTDNILTRSQDGSGIGLALSNSIVRLHFGRIRANSKPGFGSVFIVELPLRTAETTEDSDGRGIELSLPLTDMVNIELSDI